MERTMLGVSLSDQFRDIRKNFDPNQLLPENEKQVNAIYYLPFGEGLRSNLKAGNASAIPSLVLQLFMGGGSHLPLGEPHARLPP
ncbi:unnamed protein product [Parnassius mnemosyne]|uniref:Uncharacterized protein n=1 Tax=Parnassius mnemosyne TaxID=213953 RepID=A0AAV1KE69_9NEOP